MTLVPMAASFLTQVWLARTLGRVGLGEYHATSLFVIVVTALLLAGYPSAVSQRVAALEEHRAGSSARAANTAFALSLIAGAAIAVIAVLLWPTFARLYGVAQELPGALIALSTFASTLSILAVQVLLARLDVRRATAVIAAQPIGAAVGVILLIVGLPLDGSAIAAVGFVATGATGADALVRARIRPSFAMVEATALLKRSVQGTIFAYPSVITAWVDRIIIGAILGTAALGAFVAASSLVEALQRIARSIGAFGVPAYARLAGDAAGSRRVLDSHLRVLAAALIVSGTLFIAAGNGMLTLLFGEGFAIATTTLRLLSIAMLPLAIAAALGSQTFGAGSTSGSTRLIGLLIVAHVLAGTVGTKLFHIAGTALADVVIWTVGAIVYALSARRTGAPVQTRTLLHIAGVAVPLFTAGWVIGLQLLPWLVSAVLALLVALPVATVVLIQAPERRILRLFAPAVSPRSEIRLP